MNETLEVEFRNPGCSEEREIQQLGPWFHNLHLPGGVQTAPDHPLGDFPAVKWRQIAEHLPLSLVGWRVLDIGCNAGFYSFALAARGAEVLGIDIEPRYLRQAEWARNKLGHRDAVRFQQSTVYDLLREKAEFDLVLFLGVLYHLRYPLLALDILRPRVKRLLVFQTLTFPDGEQHKAAADGSLAERHLLAAPGWPKLAFIEKSFQGDPTNWWVPNDAAAHALLRSAGFSVVATPGHELYVCEPTSIESSVSQERDLALRASARAATDGEGKPAA